MGNAETQRPLKVLPYRGLKAHGNHRPITMEGALHCMSPSDHVNRQWKCKESSWDISRGNRGDGSRNFGRCHEEQVEC